MNWLRRIVLCGLLDRHFPTLEESTDDYVCDTCGGRWSDTKATDDQ